MRRELVLGVALVTFGIGSALANRPLLALALLAAGVVATVAGVRRRKPSEAVAVPPVAVPPEEVELEEGPVWACMRCGSPNMRQPRVSEGLIPGIGESLVWICPRCKFRGQPLLFDDPTAYRQFVKGLNENGSNAGGT